MTYNDNPAVLVQTNSNTYINSLNSKYIGKLLLERMSIFPNPVLD